MKNKDSNTNVDVSHHKNKIIEKLILLVLIIILYITSFIFLYEYIIIEKDYTMIAPVIIFAMSASLSLVILLLSIKVEKTEYQINDNVLILKRKNKIVIQINIDDIKTIYKYMDYFKENTHYIKFIYKNRKYRINILEKNKQIMEVFNNKKIIEKVDYLPIIDFIIRCFGGL